MSDNRRRLNMKLRKRVRRLERRLDALTGTLPDRLGDVSEPLDPHQLWDEQTERYERAGGDCEDFKGYL